MWRRYAFNGAMVLAAAALALVGNLATGTLDPDAWWWPWLVWGGTVALVLLVLVLEAIRQKRESPGPVVDLETAAAELADAVRIQWREEAVERQVFEPLPLRVRWSSTGRGVAAERDVVLDEPSDARWRETPLRGDVHDVVATFRELPHRQLVVIGRAGAGSRR